MEEVILHSYNNCSGFIHCFRGNQLPLWIMKIIVALLKDVVKAARSLNWTALITWGIIGFIAVKLIKYLLGLFA